VRVGFDAKRLFLNDRGLGSYSRNLLTGLVNYQGENEFFLYSPKASNKFISTEVTGLPHTHVRTPSGIGKNFGSLWRTFRLGAASSNDKLDIFHGLAQELPLDIKKSGAKSIVTIHDMIFVRHPEFYKPVDRLIYYNKVKFAVKVADKIVAISHQTKNDLLTEFNIAEDRISVIYQSCNEIFCSKRSAAQLDAAKKKWMLPEKFMLFVGALNENKNALVILKAMAQLNDDQRIPLVVVGKGDKYQTKMANYARDHDLAQLLIWANEFADPSPLELSSIYQLATVFVLPSFYEGFGIPILEARFSGTPVLASNSTCLQEAGGDRSLYFDPREPDRLAENLQIVLASGKSSTDVAPEEFDIRTITQQWMNLYKSLV
jgi:glycosyltransferase involved in cell wall biosynthesis